MHPYFGVPLFLCPLILASFYLGTYFGAPFISVPFYLRGHLNKVPPYLDVPLFRHSLILLLSYFCALLFRCPFISVPPFLAPSYLGTVIFVPSYCGAPYFNAL